MLSEKTIRRLVFTKKRQVVKSLGSLQSFGQMGLTQLAQSVVKNLASYRLDDFNNIYWHDV